MSQSNGRNTKWISGPLLVIVIFAGFIAVPQCDRVTVTGAVLGTSVGIHYNGADSAGNKITAFVRRSPSGKFRFKNVYPQGGQPADNNSIVAFGTDRAPVLKNAGWTEDGDDVPLELIDSVKLRVKFHVVLPLGWEDDLNGITLKKHIKDSVKITNAVFCEERFGVRLDDAYDDTEQTPDAAYGSAIPAPPMPTMPANMTAETAENFSHDMLDKLTVNHDEKGVVNVYIVGNHPGGAGSGYARMPSHGSDTKGAAILLDHKAVGILLGHEIGHVLGLVHTDGCPGFNSDTESNLMDSDSGFQRQFITEGQTLRVHFSIFSLFHGNLNSQFPLRADIATALGLDKKYGSNVPGFGISRPHCWRVWPDDEPANDETSNEHVCPEENDFLCADTTENSNGDAVLDAFLRRRCVVNQRVNWADELRRVAKRLPEDVRGIKTRLVRYEAEGISEAERPEIRRIARRMFRIFMICERRWALKATSKGNTFSDDAAEKAFVNRAIAREDWFRRQRAREGLKILAKVDAD